MTTPGETAEDILVWILILNSDRNCKACCFFPHRVALDRAAVLLTMKREMVRLDNVWGVGGGLRPVKHLIKEVNSDLNWENSAICTNQTLMSFLFF